MSVESKEIFRALTESDLSGGLDDGEAATIALAIPHSESAIAVIDERKALRIFRQRWEKRSAISTLTLLTNSRIVAGLTRKQFQDCIYSALFYARMRVPAEFQDWVVNLIGRDRACLCSSLTIHRES